MPPHPGEVYWAELPEVGQRPIVVVSREQLNRGGYVVAVQFTAAKLEARQRLANCVEFQAGQYGLTKACVAQAETIAVFDVSTMFGPIGTVDAPAMRNLVRAIGYVIDADCEPT